MSFEAALQDYFRNVSSFWIKTTARWQAMRTAVQNQNYTADRLANDVGGFWIDTMDALYNVPPYFGAPLAPTILMVFPANAPQQPKGGAFLAASVPDGAQVSCTDLVGMATADRIGQASVTRTVSAGRLEVQLVNLPANLKADAYQGIAFIGTTPLALVVAVAT